MQSADQIWASIKASLHEKNCLDEVQLRPGASESELVELEAQLGVALPDLLRQLLMIHDGQDGAGLLFGTQMLSSMEIRRQWQGWREIEADGMNEDCAEFMKSSPAGGGEADVYQCALDTADSRWWRQSHGIGFRPRH